MAKQVYKDSAFGIAVYPHINEADSKFNPTAPTYKVDLRLKGEDAQRHKEEFDAAAQAAFDEFMADPEKGGKLKPKDKAEWKVFRPYEEETDDKGDPLPGDPILFGFRQNKNIKLRDGTTKVVEIGIYDAEGNEMHKLVRGGSEIRVRYALRPITMTSLKKVGVRADFAMVQVRKLSEGSTGGGFGKVEGYVDDGEHEDQTEGGKPGEKGDY